MLTEVELSSYINKEHSPKMRVDVVIVGAGILGLLLAKKLTDLGQQIVLLEAGPTIAYGSSIKNHGWLHRGTAHAVSVTNEEEAKAVVQKLIYGHEYLKTYAPESIENPFEPVFAVTQQSRVADRAARIWDKLGVSYQEVSKSKFFQLDPNIRQDTPLFIFKSADLRINTRMLYQKLLAEIQRKGGIIICNALYNYQSEKAVEVSSLGREFTAEGDIFIYAVGAQVGQAYQKLTNQGLDISFWKSHLLLLPRVSSYSLVSMDRNQPIIINHGDLSVINRAYDEVEYATNNPFVEQQKVREAFESLCELYPNAYSLKNELKSIACIKPAIKSSRNIRYSVDSQILEPLPDHYFVLPGKMTEAPFVADEALQRIYSKLDFSAVTKRPLDTFLQNGQPLNFAQEQLNGQKLLQQRA